MQFERSIQMIELRDRSKCPTLEDYVAKLGFEEVENGFQKTYEFSCLRPERMRKTRTISQKKIFCGTETQNGWATRYSNERCTGKYDVVLHASFPKNNQCLENAKRCDALFEKIKKVFTHKVNTLIWLVPWMCAESNVKKEYFQALRGMRNRNIKLSSPTEDLRHIVIFEKHFFVTVPWLQCSCAHC